MPVEQVPVDDVVDASDVVECGNYRECEFSRLRAQGAEIGRIVDVQTQQLESLLLPGPEMVF